MVFKSNPHAHQTLKIFIVNSVWPKRIKPEFLRSSNLTWILISIWGPYAFGSTIHLRVNRWQIIFFKVSDNNKKVINIIIMLVWNSLYMKKNWLFAKFLPKKSFTIIYVTIPILYLILFKAFFFSSIILQS
jgi:hypothetical protein